MLSLSMLHFEGVCFGIIEAPAPRSVLSRLEAHLDGLRIEGEGAVALAVERLAAAEDDDDVAAAALVIVECGGRSHVQFVFDRLTEGNAKIGNAIRRGLRLAPVGKIPGELQELLSHSKPVTQAAALDVLTFHRSEAKFDLERLAVSDSAIVRLCVAEAAGRMQPFQHASLLRSLIGDEDGMVRRSALRAAARQGLRGLVDLCRSRATSKPACVESIRFLGVVGTEDDRQLLRQLAGEAPTCLPAIKAMGAQGLPRLIPNLLDFLSQPALNDAAALALERITGYSVPRGNPPAPPADATEEVLDFWAPPAVAIPESAIEWWRENRTQFVDGKRYQAGICVSDEPLGSHFDDLPDESRYDVYLRERAYHGTKVPDWELETWPWHQRNPRWATQR